MAGGHVRAVGALVKSPFDDAWPMIEKTFWRPFPNNGLLILICPEQIDQSMDIEHELDGQPGLKQSRPFCS